MGAMETSPTSPWRSIRTDTMRRTEPLTPTVAPDGKVSGDLPVRMAFDGVQALSPLISERGEQRGAGKKANVAI